jgi:hypothetical protein
LATRWTIEFISVAAWAALSGSLPPSFKTFRLFMQIGVVLQYKAGQRFIDLRDRHTWNRI